MEQQLLNFGQAIEAMNQGKVISREQWNGKGMFVCKYNVTVAGPEIIPGMSSIPSEVKRIIMARSDPKLMYTNQLAIVYGDGTLTSWTPTTADIFALDWKIVEDEV